MYPRVVIVVDRVVSTAVKFPPAITCPLDWRAMQVTPRSGDGLNVASRVPSEFSLARYWNGVVPMAVKVPPIRIFPSGWSTMASTSPLGLGLKEGSEEHTSELQSLRHL